MASQGWRGQPPDEGVRFAPPLCQPSEELRNSTSDGITTLTINNIPIHLRTQQLLALLDQTGFKGCYDYFYLPCNYKEGTNRGHAFINLCTPLDAKRSFASWHGARLFSDETIPAAA